ncbi:MAG: DUF2249 domain-containing protein [Burkholderiales bacterium]|nr:DUF2249 domain-containing protein [Burkholderiales bacterium]
MSATKVIDARGLPPPQPFELVMEALCELAPGDEILLVLEREPTPLYQVLERNGYQWRTTLHPEDGRVEVRIRERGSR